MIDKNKLLKHPNYLLTKYQSEIFRQLKQYMKANDLSQKDIAKKLGVSNSYVNQILKGNFNYTLKKLIEISLFVGKIPSIEFLEISDYWNFQNKKKQDQVIKAIANKYSNTILVKVPSYSIVHSTSTRLMTAPSSESLASNHSWVLQCNN